MLEHADALGNTGLLTCTRSNTMSDELIHPRPRVNRELPRCVKSGIGITELAQLKPKTRGKRPVHASMCTSNELLMQL